jgi:hypothetical protein
VKAAIGTVVAAVAETLGRVVSPKSKRRAARRPPSEEPVATSLDSAPEAAPPALADEAFAFPETYGRTRVRLLMQSPGRLFVHWDLSPGVIEDLKAQLGRRAASLARLAIRITTAEAGPPLLVLLPKGARSWYVDVPSHRQEYRAELGLMLPSGEFQSLAASNPLRLPRTSPSPVPAGRRVEFSRDSPPESGSLDDAVPDDVLSNEERAERDAQSGPEHVVIDAEARPASDGSSELSGRAARRRSRAGPRRDAPESDLGGASDLAPRGSSSDLRPRR